MKVSMATRLFVSRAFWGLTGIDAAGPAYLSMPSRRKTRTCGRLLEFCLREPGGGQSPFWKKR